MIATAVVTLEQQQVGFQGNPGRSHARWYADVEEEGQFHWYETAFYPNGGIRDARRRFPMLASLSQLKPRKR